MASRISLDDFFLALRKHGGYPVVDSPEIRAILLKKLAQISQNYPIKSAWPVADVEFAYEQYLNNSPDQIIHTREYRYMGTVNLKGFNRAYSLDEWFDDFRLEYKLKDDHVMRQRMLDLLPQGSEWPPSLLYQAY